MGFLANTVDSFYPPQLKAVMDEINNAYEEVRNSDAFKNELAELMTHFVGRPSPIYHAKNLSKKCGGAQIYL